MDDGRNTGAGAQAPAPGAEGGGASGARGAPLYEVTLWPNRSLSPAGFRLLIAGAGAVMLLPLVWVAGTRVLWFVLPFVVIDLSLLWWFMRLNYRAGRLTETLRLWPDLVTVERREPSGRVLRWEANPYWVQVGLRAEGKVDQYLTLKGGGREIELGAFLSPEERVTLKSDLERELARARQA